MRQWSDCKTTQERQAALVEALQVARGVKSNAAKLLGMNRQHLHRWLRSSSARDGVAPGDTVASRDTLHTVATLAGGASSNSEPLTRSGGRPTFAIVSTAPTVIDEEVTVTLRLPRRCVEWLDVEAVKRKYASGQSKAAKAPIVVEMIERAMAGEKQPKKDRTK
jgi:hypothetical protein